MDLVQLLRSRALEEPGKTAYTFLRDGETVDAELAYGRLDLRARAIAAALQLGDGGGERAILLFPAGLDFITAFFGCLYAGVVAVPCYPPSSRRPQPRLRSIARDARPRLVLTTSALEAERETVCAHVPELAAASWIAIDRLADELADGWGEAAPGAEGLAFLQYTSGSTADPKGVMVSHGNLLHNEELIRTAFRQSEASVIVGWLPLYHDMGLIGNVLQPLYVGARCVLMSPLAFLQQPARWLLAISRYRATTSGGPNFAYDLCVRKVPPTVRAELDLSSWSLAFNGAEPVRGSTLERFVEAFAPCGFRRQAFYPCYGLAEATLFVSGGETGDGPVAGGFDARELERNRAIEQPGEGLTRRLVGCGRAWGGQRIAVVDPETGAPCPPRVVGEVWVAGPSVAQGYWERSEETAATFQARLATGEGPYLRTGDLGFLREGELFVTGRRKDLLILRGRNFYPQDLEQLAESSHPALRPGGCAAFAVEVDGEAPGEREERAVLVCELERRAEAPHEEVWGAVRRAVAEELEVSVHEVVLVATSAVPKTSSGKVQRLACRRAYLAGELAVVGRSLAGGPSEAVPQGAPEKVQEPPAAIERRRLLTLPQAERAAALEGWLRQVAARACRAPVPALPADRPLTELGLDSLAGVEIQQAVDGALGVPLSISRLLAGATLSELAGEIAAALDPLADGETASDLPEPSAFPLSYGQRALWFLDRLSPESAAYNIAAAASLDGALDRAAFAGALQDLLDRQAALSTRFELRGDELCQVVSPRLEASRVLQVEDSTAWSESRCRERLEEEARRPFDLEAGPPFRVLLLERAGERHYLLLVLHHLIADFWSLVVLLAELEALYRLRTGQVASPPPALTSTYGDYVRWQASRLATAAGAELEAFWQRQLAGNLPVLELPADRPRPAVQTFRGGSVPLGLAPEVAADLGRLCRQAGATLFMGLLAAFQALLHRLAGQREVLVGTPTSGRGAAAWADLVGYFVNPVVVRADLGGSPGFASLLARQRPIVLAAFEHQDFPFALVAERLQSERDAGRPPIFQAMLILQKAQRSELERLATFALGEGNARLSWAGLELEAVRLGWRPAPFDLTLVMAGVGEALAGALQFNADLFDETTARRWSGHFASLVRALVTEPERPLASLPLLAGPESAQLLGEWNDSAVAPAAPAEVWVHRAIERRAEERGDAVAVICRGESLSYRELNARANRLARHLRALGVDREARVGICLERSLDMVVALLAVLKAGGAYLPLDPAYPRARLELIVRDAAATVLLTRRRWARRFRGSAAHTVSLDADCAILTTGIDSDLPAPVGADGLAYLIYTSGSTGTPKGVMVSHGNVTNFFAGMDERLGTEPGCWLAVTSISFDISVLELLWTLARGFEVVLEAGADAPLAARASLARPVDFSLFYFASDEGSTGGQQRGAGKYRLLMEGARFADRHGFAAVWTPERHFHAFGGLYPNPAITGAAIAAVTERVGIRAGSVVLPLHHPVRVAEEWSVVDNLSGGRVGISLASGWNAADFLFAPATYDTRKEVLESHLDTVRRLWRGEALRFPGPKGEVEIRILPRPVQPELPLWLTAAGSPDTFRRAGELGVNLLTHLLGQSARDLAEKISVYRAAWKAAGHAGEGQVALMLHTFVGDETDAVRETVRAPFTNYLASSLDLMKVLAPGQDLAGLTAEEHRALLDRAFDRYFETSGLFGTPETCLERVAELAAVGVDEIACLIDFGVDGEEVLAGLELLAELREAACRPADGLAEAEGEATLPALVARHGVTHLQCTPSAATALLADPEAPAALSRLRLMMVGGEALPAALAERLAAHLGGELLNMYGPTETTIWSAVGGVEGTAITLGRPIANTELRITDPRLRLVPAGQPGELSIGGDGVVRGYFARPALTAERFVPDPWSGRAGSRLYRTGDLARWLPDGRPVFLGRVDHQVKLRGHRIELGEIEAVLARHPAVREAVVTVREDVPGDQRLVAYLVPAAAAPADLSQRLDPARTERLLAARARHQLANGMVVAHLSAEQTSAIYGEIFEQEIYLRHGVELPEEGCIFDVGANIGLFTLFASSRAPRAQVYSFEPIPATFEVLRSNVELYGLSARVFPLGISDREEEADLTFYPRMAGLSGRFAAGDEEATRSIVQAWLERSGKAGGDGPGGEEIAAVVRDLLASEIHRCRLRPLSALMRELEVERIDLLKVDVEKSELEVLRGIADADWPKIRQLVLEVHSRELLEETSALLAARGYDLAVDEFIPSGEWGEAVWMVYARRPADPLSGQAPVQLSVAELRAHMEERLPQVMRPSAYVVLEAFPLTPNRKIDRRALPAPDGRRSGIEKAYVAPQDETQLAVAAVWHELLRVDEIGIHDNFFEAGGNSLLLVEAHSRLRRALGREITLVELMRYPTVSSLARHLDETGNGAGGNGAASALAAAEARQVRLDERMTKQRQSLKKRDGGKRDGKRPGVRPAAVRAERRPPGEEGRAE